MKPSDRSRPYSKRDLSKIQCHNCKEMGHFAWQCVKVNIVSLPGLTSSTHPPVMKPGKIGAREHLWCMDSGADMCFVAKDLLSDRYQNGPPVHARGALHPDGKICLTVIFDAEIAGCHQTHYPLMHVDLMCCTPFLIKYS